MGGTGGCSRLEHGAARTSLHLFTHINLIYALSNAPRGSITPRVLPSRPVPGRYVYNGSMHLVAATLVVAGMKKARLEGGGWTVADGGRFLWFFGDGGTLGY